MDPEKPPDPVHLITFLRVLGFREREKKQPDRSNPLKEKEFQIEINCGNPPMNIAMEFPDVTLLEANQSERNDDGFPQVSHDFPMSKLKVVKEVFGMLMEFLLEQDGEIKRKDKILEQQHWRRCMSLGTLAGPTPQLCLPVETLDENRNAERVKELEIKVMTVDMDEGCSNEGLKPSINSDNASVMDGKLAEAMEVDVPALNNSSLPESNLSPIGLARQRTWVLQTSISENKGFDKAKTSTPTKPHITAKIGLNASHALSKIVRPRQARTDVQPQRLRLANTETVRSMTQMRNARELSSRISNKSKSSSASSASSVSSHSFIDSTRTNAFHKTSSKLSVPVRHELAQSVGAKPKQLSHLGVGHQLPVPSELSTSATSRKHYRVSQMKKDGGMQSTNHAQMKEEQLPLRKAKPSEMEKLSADGVKKDVKLRPSLLPRFNSFNKRGVANKESKVLGKP
ncbi:uncharacterized protein [Hetaerina americana]|uniref:uncharacterized protein n=1 Tax=Hetaerina americana TaxID=62018 RepID=UPI003A7F2132